MQADHVVLFVLGAFVFAILLDNILYRLRHRGNDIPVNTARTADSVSSTPITSSAPAESKFASVDQVEEQFKQTLTLSASIRELEDRFHNLQVREAQSTRSESVKREFVILAEQLRIARSFENELLRHVFSWRGGSSSDSNFASNYRPTHAQATWAYTAANLTISFAGARLQALAG